MQQHKRLIIGLVVVGTLLAALAVPVIANALPFPSGVNGLTWVLVSLDVDGHSQALLASVTITLTVTEADHTLGGTSGCNSYGVAYWHFGERVVMHSLITTEIACAQPILQQESQYQHVLKGAETLHRLGGATHEVLTISGNGGKDVLGFNLSP